MERAGMGSIDPETLFLSSEQKTGNEWELFKENVRPLKRGRQVGLLNEALKAQTDNQLKKSLIDTRRRMIQAIDEYNGDDPLRPWLDCIKWVQEAFPPGGDGSALVVIYEQCVRAFWHSDRYKDDLRYLKVWLEYAENCADAEVIYRFLDANRIGQSHSLYFISYALYMESKSRIKSANEIFNWGISRNAQPREKLETAYRKFLVRSMKGSNMTNEDSTEDHLSVRSFGTVIASGEPSVRSFGTVIASAENRWLPGGSSDHSRKKLKSNRSQNSPFSIYNETSREVNQGHQADEPRIGLASWGMLGSQADRNKENNALPSKWKTNKIPQRHASRTVPPTNCIDVFVDECTETMKMNSEMEKASVLQCQQADGSDLKKEIGLLRKNPLRNFPSSSLPR